MNNEKRFKEYYNLNNRPDRFTKLEAAKRYANMGKGIDIILHINKGGFECGYYVMSIRDASKVLKVDDYQIIRYWETSK